MWMLRQAALLWQHLVGPLLRGRAPQRPASYTLASAGARGGRVSCRFALNPFHHHQAVQLAAAQDQQLPCLPAPPRSSRAHQPQHGCGGGGEGLHGA